MKMMIGFKRAVGLLGAAWLGAQAAFAADVPQRIQLLPAPDLNAFYPFINKLGAGKDPNQVFQLRDGVLRVSGGQQGYLATRQEYANYRLVAEYRWGTGAPDRDSGVFIHMTGEDRWLPSAIEVNLLGAAKDRVSGELVLLGKPGPSLTVGNEPKQAFAIIKPVPAKDNERAMGEWNTLEILCEGDRLAVSLNGQRVLEGTAVRPAQGRIFLQSNKGEIFFRKLELHPAR